jgi:hypothetical protein|tara:strand:+ start:343 stop:1071 length:729 start_codon:yes stop_codon:yes gene_type:complete
MNNYKKQLAHLTKDELIDYIDVTPLMAERFENEHIGATHLTDAGGADGELPCGRSVEIKTQCFSGKYQLRGRGKYGAASMDIYKRKLEKNEHTIVTGFDASSGDVFYRFAFDFEAIAPNYLHVVNSRLDRGLGVQNYDAYLHHYLGHPSFTINQVSDPAVLWINRDKFTGKFYMFLLYHAITGKIDYDYTSSGKSSARCAAEGWLETFRLSLISSGITADKVTASAVANYFNKIKERINNGN